MTSTLSTAERRTQHRSTHPSTTQPSSTRRLRLRIKIMHRRQRYVIRHNPLLDQSYRIAVGVVGTVMMVAGLVMIPLSIPGPGWVTLFLGLAVLSTEFVWAQRVTHWLRAQLHRAAVAWNLTVAWTRSTLGRIGRTIVSGPRALVTRLRRLPA